MTTIKNATAHDAAIEYINRQDRISHPEGSFDNAGRFYPDKNSEFCECCKTIRTPSRSYPFSYMTHCRSKKHVANLYDVSVKELNAALKAIDD